ncbi:MAG: hypothetical protein JWP18_407 [Solirubrobacterales bacterium]|nr:hypothetical protein [Solirubrobacterales bacterium]
MSHAVAEPEGTGTPDAGAVAMARPPAPRRTLRGRMAEQGDTDEGDQAAAEGPQAPPVPSSGGRLWTLRIFVLALLLAGAGTVAVAAVTIVNDSDRATGTRTGQFGVVMPDAGRYRATVAELLARDRPRELRGLTVTGTSGEVTVLRAKRRTVTTFPSSYLNPGALALIARSIGLRSDTVITVDELRLEKLRGTGRLRWRLRGEQAGRPWRAVIAPNGTDLRLLPVNAS